LSNKRSYKKLAFNILRILIPAGLLTYIFLNIDIEKLALAFKKVDIAYFLLSVLLMNIMLVITAGIRWFFMLRKDIRTEKPARYVAIYWIAMFYGYFVPSNVGMDVYRVFVAGRKKKNYEQHIAVLFGEKIYTLAITIVLMYLGFIMVYRQVENTEIAHALKILSIGLLVFLVFVLIFYFLFRNRFREIKDYLGSRFSSYVNRISLRLGSKLPFDFSSFRHELKYVGGRQFFSSTFLFTLLLRGLLVAGGYFLFLSMGIELSFWALLFANTLFFIIFILPVSFGSLGIREGAYILIYGLFGVSPETALAASFLALAGLVFTISLGGLLSLSENFIRIKPGYGE